MHCSSLSGTARLSWLATSTLLSGNAWSCRRVKHEPAVKHAIAAIGALHEKLLTGAADPNAPQDKDINFALEQCNKSIQHLVTPAEGGKSPDLRLLLITCVLFTCFEALQGNCKQAIVHATQGYSLLQQYVADRDCWEIKALAVELSQLCLLMRRLQTQSEGLSGKKSNIVPNMMAARAERPTRFSNLREARSGLAIVLGQLTVYFMDLDLNDQHYDLAVSHAEKYLVFATWLESWEKAFSDYLAQHQDPLTRLEGMAAMILKAHHLVASILSQIDLSLGEQGWDALHGKFAAIVDLATAVVEGTTQADASVIDIRWETASVFISASTDEVSFSLGVVDPLYEVCARCRDPLLRRKALRLLALHPRQECMWNTWSAWKVVKFLLRLEKEGAEVISRGSSDIAAERRVAEAWFDFSDKSLPAGRGKVAYRTPRYGLYPGLFNNTPTGEPGFTGTVQAGTVPAASRPCDFQHIPSTEGVSLAAVNLSDFTLSSSNESDTVTVVVPSMIEPQHSRPQQVSWL